jgi:hypothetical protein
MGEHDEPTAATPYPWLRPDDRLGFLEAASPDTYTLSPTSSPRAQLVVANSPGGLALLEELRGVMGQYLMAPPAAITPPPDTVTPPAHPILAVPGCWTSRGCWETLPALVIDPRASSHPRHWTVGKGNGSADSQQTRASPAAAASGDMLQTFEWG